MTREQIKSKKRIINYGEVFTNKKEVNVMCDLVIQETEKIDSKFLEPACGDGNFLIEILKRKLNTIKRRYKDICDWERFSLLAISSLYGIEILEDNVIVCKNRLYDYWKREYEIINNKKHNKKILDFAKYILEHNIICGNTLSGRCVDEEGRDTEKPIIFSEWIFLFDDMKIQKRDYIFNELLNKNDIEKVFDINFDVIIGNPPYQLNDGGGTGDSAKPIYQLFIQQAKKIRPKYLVMIVPSRWMKGGKGLDSFRKEMIEDKRIKYIYDFEDAKECFPGIHLDGGVNYFLWDKSYNGMCEYHYKALNGNKNKSIRYLKNDISETVIRDYNQISIINKATEYHEEKFSKICSARNPFGFYSDLFNEPEKYPKAKLSMEEDKNKLKVYGVKGKKGGSKRVVGYVDKESVEKLKEDVEKYKLYFSKAYTTTATVPPEIIIGVPNTVCTETFIEIGTFETEREARNCLSYIKTKFFRALLLYNRHSLNISRKSFDLIPLQNFDEEWNDTKLYKKYNLTKEEIKFIESNILEMGD